MKLLDVIMHGAGRVTSRVGYGPAKRKKDAPALIDTDPSIFEAERAAQYDLLRFVDGVCRERGIGYFIFGDTLHGAINYGDFVPGVCTVSVGMERHEYQRFAAIISPLAGEHGYRFEPMCGWLGNVPRPMPVICREVPGLPAPDGTAGYQQDGAASPTFACLEISIFDALPDDFDVRKGHLRRMKRLNFRARSTAEARASLLGQVPAKGGRVRLIGRLLQLRSFSAHRLARYAQRYNGRGMTQVTRLAGPRTAFANQDALAPFGRIKFGPLEVNCPADPSPWAVDVAAQDLEAIRPLQQSVKRILVEVDRVCRELGIGYFLCGGTLLGWKRHGGYIPWDDDMDIGMLRADYDVFRERAGALLGEEFFLQTRETDPNIPYLFSKVRMNGTEYITAYNERRPFHKGLCLDIFPFDAIPNDEDEQERFQKKVRKRARIHHRVASRQIVEPADLPLPKDFETQWFRFFGRVHRWTFWHIPLQLTQAWYLRLATKYDARAGAEGLHSVGSFVPTYTHVRLDDLLPYRDAQFEDVTAMVPNRPEVFLEMQYGDYMTLPPFHEQIGHALLRWSDAEGENANPTTDM